MRSKSDKSRIFKNSVIVTSATVLEKIFFFIISVLIARYLKIEHYGEYTTALEFATFFSTFTNIGINQALIRAINIESRYEKEHFTNNLILKTFLAIIAYIVLVISLFFTNYNSDIIYLTLIFGFVRIGNEFLVSFYALNDAKEQFSVQAIFTSLFSMSFLASTIIIILVNGNYFHFAYVRAILVIIFLLVILIMTFKNFNLKFNLLTLKKFIKETIPFSLSIVYGNLIQRTNIIILSLMHGPVYSGIFNNGYLFYVSLQFIPINLHRVLLPYLYKIQYEDNKEKFQFAFDIFSKYLTIISFFILINIFLYSKDIIITLFGEKYRDSINILKIISLGIPFMFSIAITIITALDKQRIVSNITGICAIINIIANIILIYFFKTEGAAIAVVVTIFFIFLFTHLYLRIKNFIKLKKILLIYIKLIIITGITFAINQYFLKIISILFSITIINLIFIIAAYIFVVNKNDIRIIKETLGIG